MNESQLHPMSDELGLLFNHAFKQSEIWIVCLPGLRIVAANRVVRQDPDISPVFPGGKKLKGSNSDMGLGHTCKDSSREHAFSRDLVSRSDRSKRPGRRHAQRSHCFRKNILADDRPQRRKSVTPPRERGRAGTFQLDVTADSVLTNHFSKQQSPPVTQLR